MNGSTGQRYRIQTWLVLSSLERIIADYLVKREVKLDAATTTELRLRYSKHNSGNAEKASTTELLSETYLAELIDIGISSMRETQQSDGFLQLKKYVS